MEAKRTRLHELLDLAIGKNLVKGKGDFAAFIGIDGGSLSHALKDDGKVSLENTIARAEHALMNAGVNVSTSCSGGGVDSISNPDVKDIVQTLVGEMAAQREANERERDRLLTLIEKLTTK